LLHLIFGVAGTLLGWYLRHHSLGVSPDLVDALGKIAARHKENQAQGLLQDLLEHLRNPPPSAPHP
jgi:hypothetical protein